MREFCLNVEPVLNPQPPITPGGDCFACALTAGLSWLQPDRPLTVARAIDYFRQEDGHVVTSWPGMDRALKAARRDGYRIEHTADIVHPQMNPHMWSHAWWGWEPELEYARRLEGWLRGGWVAFTEIRQDGSGMLTTDLRLNATDHFVLLDGIRYVWDRFPDDTGAAYNQYVHVVCSVKGGYWMRLQQFLRRHGGSGWWLARNDDR